VVESHIINAKRFVLLVDLVALRGGAPTAGGRNNASQVIQLRDACGVVGVCLTQDSTRDVFPVLYYALYALQHRGQESAGISIFRERMITKKGMGLVSDVFTNAFTTVLEGKIGIGHVRYSTTGESDIINCQPFVVSSEGREIAIAHNGNLVNAIELKHELQKEGAVFISTSDTEVIAQLLAREMRRRDELEAISFLMRVLRGSYSLVILINDTLYAIRDPYGVKPLCIGRLEDGYVVASESAVIDTLEGKLMRDVKPGEVIIIRDGEMESQRLYKLNTKAHCVFEYIYFARPDSIIDGKLVYDVRIKIGETLWDEHPIDADVVSPVPDSGITFAIGFSRRSGIEYLEGLIKNRYVGRTFIMPAQRERELAVRLKLNTISSNIEGKNIVLVDDSIVRGTTSRRIVDMVRACNPKSIHLRIGSPPIKSPCYLGIDMPTREELVASSRTTDEIARVVGVDSLGYLSIDGLVDAIGMGEDDLCLGCLTGVYPMEIPGEKCKAIQARLSNYII